MVMNISIYLYVYSLAISENHVFLKNEYCAQKS